MKLNPYHPTWFQLAPYMDYYLRGEYEKALAEALKFNFARSRGLANSGFSEMPERGRIVPELRDQGILQYRELVISPWRILYRISEKSDLVLSVLDSRRNIEDILLKRLTNSKI